MRIEKNKVVAFHYTMTAGDGDVVEESRDGDPIVYLHGHHGLIKGLEKVMEGHAAGDRFTVTVTPEEGYGQPRENAVQRVSKSHITGNAKLKMKLAPGMVVQVNTAEGPRAVIVVKVGLKTVDVDSNHPLAGKTLVFEVEIADVRDATQEEIAHGHAHGAGGHAHG